MTAPFGLSAVSSDGDMEARGHARRVAVLLEMEDGTLVTFYSETGGEVTLATEAAPMLRYWNGYGADLRPAWPARHAVHVEGLTSYTMTENVPDFTRSALDMARKQVEP